MTTSTAAGAATAAGDRGSVVVGVDSSGANAGAVDLAAWQAHATGRPLRLVVVPSG